MLPAWPSGPVSQAALLTGGSPIHSTPHFTVSGDRPASIPSACTENHACAAASHRKSPRRQGPEGPRGRVWGGGMARPPLVPFLPGVSTGRHPQEAGCGGRADYPGHLSSGRQGIQPGCMCPLKRKLMARRFTWQQFRVQAHTQPQTRLHRPLRPLGYKPHLTLKPHSRI